jgi:hypothetical protein
MKWLFAAMSLDGSDVLNSLPGEHSSSRFLRVRHSCSTL